MGKKVSDQWDFYECDWCRCRVTWQNRPCIRSRVRDYNIGFIRGKREYHQSIRMENAAKRNKSLPKVYRKATALALANSTGSVADSSLCIVVESDELDRDIEALSDTEAEAGSDTETETPKDQAPLSCAGASKPAACLTRRQKSAHENSEDTKKPSLREAKACTGPIPQDIPVVNERANLTLSDANDDIAKIHDANRKAWPRGQEPISARATIEDREIAELVRRGLIGSEPLQVDHCVFDDAREEACPYTVRYVEERRGKKRAGRNQRQEHGVVEHAGDTESDWWYLDDEAYARVLSDGGTELLDWSETSSFVHVD